MMDLKLPAHLPAVVLLVSLFAGCGGGGGGSASSVTPTAAVVNTGVVAGAGRTTMLTANQLAFIEQGMAPTDTLFVVQTKPTGGQIVLSGQPTDRFTQADIIAGKLAYRHAGGAEAQDSFALAIHNANGKLVYHQLSVEIRIVQNIVTPLLSLTGSTVLLSWQNPAGKEYSGLQILRREDGQYPSTPLDGSMIYSGNLMQTEASDTLPENPDGAPAQQNYTLFSVNGSGIYSGGVQAGVYCDSGMCVTVPDLRTLTRYQSPTDINSHRSALINNIWGGNTLPDWLPNVIYPVQDSSMTNAGRIDEVIVSMDYGLSSRMRHYIPLTGNGDLIIYHQGHGGQGGRTGENINTLLGQGFQVLNISMPLTGYNLPSDPTAPLQSHDDLAGLDRPMRFFLEPVVVGLNYLQSTAQFGHIYMTGISGGGWTTLLYAALDPRITASYPVAGSWPFYLRTQFGGPSVGDFEQTNPDFYAHASYIELYIMGAYARRQLQIYNQFDTCCFGGTFSETFRPFVKSSVEHLGGSFDIAIDDSFTGHDISASALSLILDDIQIQAHTVESYINH